MRCVVLLQTVVATDVNDENVWPQLRNYLFCMSVDLINAASCVGFKVVILECTEALGTDEIDGVAQGLQLGA